MPHQRRAIRFCSAAHDNCILALAPGTGKTLVAIRRRFALSQGEQASISTLVICRRDDFLTWQLELEMEGINSETHSILLIDNQHTIKRTLKNFPNATWDFVFVTYGMMRNQHVYNFVTSNQWDMVIADEAHALKRWTAQQTKRCIRGTRHITRRLALTGTPITNEMLDCFTLCLFVDNGRTFGDKEWDFLKRYYVRGYPHGWYLRRASKAIIARKLKPIMMHVHEDDVLSLPPVRHVIKAVPMAPAQRNAYDQVLNEWEIQVQGNPDKFIEINLIVVQLQKLKQIASGFFYDQFHEAHRIESTKLDLLLQLAQGDLKKKKKIVVWCSYTDEIRRIEEALMGIDGITATRLFYGEMDREARSKSRIMFRDNPEVRWFIAQVDAGLGMNELIVSDTAIYFSNSFKVVSRQQSMRRTRRKGSENHKIITYYDLVTEGSIDLEVLKSVQSSMDLAQSVLNKLKQGASLREVLHA
jgi:SNF2 family DNA or RNA helicase